ncbi:ATP-binding protein [uncultured Alistipes sp.]|uniref:ATP-binding protein n=1 Tax=uncultured Alistipes sp. TaxID=538949 RepID=UPI002630CAFE|nr:ATP-binding protein [uncultured Alistipes sp.]
MKESKFVKTKIVAGYVILIAVCILSVGYVYREVVRFSAPDGTYAQLHTKRSAVNQVLYHLYQAESCGQLMIAGYQSYEERYRQELRTVRSRIDSLRTLTGREDSLQTMRLDSIVRLLADKERRTTSLFRSIRGGATASLLEKNIRALIESSSDSLPGTVSPADSLPPLSDSLPPLSDSLPPLPDSLPPLPDSLQLPPLPDSVLHTERIPIGEGPHSDSSTVLLADTLILTRPMQIDTLPRLRRIVQTDTVSVPRAKRRFFRRLADLFSPPREETAVVISSSEIVVDTVPAPAQAMRPDALRDTIAIVLRALQDSVTSERLYIYDEAWREGLRLRYSNDLINAKIYRLIMDFEEEETDYLMRRIDENEAIRSRSSRMLGWVAAGAVVLMLLFVAVLWRDINRSNRYRRALERANRDNEALLAAREQLMLAITHDIKAPLGSVMGYIDLLSRLTTDKRQTLYLQNMRSSSEHLLALVNSLLDFYRLDANKMEVDSVVFNPSQLFETIRAGFAAAADAKGLELRLEIGPGAAREATGDAFRIRQIADNLISNALKFTDEGSVTLRADVADGWLTFSVRDTGRGIGPEERERIFAEFVRLRSAQGVDGFGLGLSIVDRLVKLLGGTIALDSEPGRGSRFIVRIPVGEAPEPDPAPVPVEASETVPAEELRVLLVDDDRLQLEMVAAMCRRAGFSVECCPYPEYAAKLISEGHFDLVVTDIQMPAFDGFRVLAAIREVNPSLPVVAVSARGEMSPEDFAARGFTACLRKPFSYGELTATIRRVCGGGRQPLQGSEAPDTGQTGPEGIRFDALTAYAGDDAEAARSILASFAEQTAANCASLERALAAGDRATVRAFAHKMLPIFTMLGAAAVATVLRRAEGADDPFPEALSADLAVAVTEIRKIVAEAERRVGTGKVRG